MAALCATTRSTRARRSSSYAAKARRGSCWSRRHLASTTLSSMAMEAPWAAFGAAACAASPMITMVSENHRGVVARS